MRSSRSIPALLVFLSFAVPACTSGEESSSVPKVVAGGIDVLAETSRDSANGPLDRQYLATFDPLGNNRLMSAYHVVSFADNLQYAKGLLGAVHLSPGRVGELRGTGTRAIVEIGAYLFQSGTVSLSPSIDQSLAALAAELAPNMDLVLAMYITDEPYLWGMTRSTLEAAIAKVNQYFNAVPTYITFAHHCFDPSSADPACHSAPHDRGIPVNLDWVGFDYYTEVFNADLATAQAAFQDHVVGGVARIKALTTKPIILVPEAFTLFIQDPAVVESIVRQYLDLANSTTQVLGVDLFDWNNFPGIAQGGEASGWLGVTGLGNIYALVVNSAPVYLCRLTGCGNPAIPRGPFRVMTNGVYSAFFSTGNAYCAFDSEATWLSLFASPIGDSVFRMYPRVPNLPYQGVCQVGSSGLAPQKNTLKPPRTPGNFFGDGRTDAVVFRSGSGEWWYHSQPAVAVWGGPGDLPAAADYNGDGTSEIMIFRPATGEWWPLNSNPSHVWGGPGDVPVPGDYDGNGASEPAVWRPSTGEWWSYGRDPVAVFGNPSDVPVPADYNGDGTTDVAVWRPSTGEWFIYGQSAAAFGWGRAGDVPVPGDYDGDGRSEPAVWSPANGEWWLYGNTSPSYLWGAAGDIPAIH